MKPFCPLSRRWQRPEWSALMDLRRLRAGPVLPKGWRVWLLSKAHEPCSSRGDWWGGVGGICSGLWATHGPPCCRRHCSVSPPQAFWWPSARAAEELVLGSDRGLLAEPCCIANLKWCWRLHRSPVQSRLICSGSSGHELNWGTYFRGTKVSIFKHQKLFS